jgi:hypothetical protein
VMQGGNFWDGFGQGALTGLVSTSVSMAAAAAQSYMQASSNPGENQLAGEPNDALPSTSKADPNSIPLANTTEAAPSPADNITSIPDRSPVWDLPACPRGCYIESVTMNEQYPGWTRTPMTKGIDGISEDGQAVVSLKSTIQVRPNYNKYLDYLEARPEQIKVFQIVAPHDVILQNWAQLAAECETRGIYLIRTNY